MADNFKYDVFLSHSAKDKEIVRPIAERLRADGLRVWFDEWEIRPGDSIPAKFEEGLEQARVLVLCMSENAFGSDWARLEAGTYRFRDPLNKARRFVPLRLDEAPIKGSLAQFLFIDWRLEHREQAYSKLLEACGAPAGLSVTEIKAAHEQFGERAVQLDYNATVWSYAFSVDRKLVLSGALDNTLRLWEVGTGRCLRVFEGHTDDVDSAAWSADQHLALSSSKDLTVRLWDIKTGRCLRVFEGHTDEVRSVIWSVDQRFALSGGDDNTLNLWDVRTGRCLRAFKDSSNIVLSLAWGTDQNLILSGHGDGLIRRWDFGTGRCVSVLEGHTELVWSLALSSDQRFALSGCGDKTLRLWEIKTGRCLRVLEGHTGTIWDVKWSTDQRHALSGSDDDTVRLWDIETGRCLGVLKGHKTGVKSVAWSTNRRSAFSADQVGGIRVWDLSKFVNESSTRGVPAAALQSVQGQVQYTNAKVLLVGESGVGKTGLSKRLALNDWQPSDSTVGAWATQWK